MLLKALFAVLTSVALAPTAWAHFVWIDLKTNGGQGQVRLYFSELPQPGEPHLIAKVAHAKAWLRTPAGSTDVKLSSSPNKEDVALVAPCAGATEGSSLEATCDYGVYERGPVPVLLHYYAKHLAGDWAKHADKLARADRLTLDIVPRIENGQVRLQVLYQGKPAAGSVVVLEVAGDEKDLKTDDSGVVTLPAAADGRYALHANYIEPNRGGTRDGKSYGQTWHYSTLSFAAPTSLSANATEPTAGELLVRARDGRSMWKNFPGFDADLTVQAEGAQVKGKVRIDADGNVSLNMPASPLAEWVEEQMQSMVQHRMPDGEVSTGSVTYTDDDKLHPLGRKIDLGDPELKSAYRIKDDAIMEVNRMAGPMRFTISVMEIVRNAENKYLPRSFTMNFFDAKTGELATSLGYLNEWQRVGAFDLPKTIIEINSKRGGATTRQISFSNCWLIK